MPHCCVCVCFGSLFRLSLFNRLKSQKAFSGSLITVSDPLTLQPTQYTIIQLNTHTDVNYVQYLGTFCFANISSLQ